MSIPIKSEKEIKKMQEGGKILAEVLETVITEAKPGISTYELDELAEKIIINHGAKPGFKGYQGFPNTLCTAIDKVIVHGIPSKNQILQEGDLFTVDCGVLYKGFYTDAARSKGIGKISKEKERLLKTANIALEKATNLAKPGTHINEIGKIIQTTVEEEGFHIIKDLTGHGVGRNLHEDPTILNFWEGNPGPILKEGMTIAIEPIFSAGTSEMKTANDGWTLVTDDNSSAIQVENTVLITQNGPEVLTKT
ncbi:type I methionyl aminopeptidase [Candidatus Peregrinibacteria bacterium]|nr:type I methionyl aminopeptidase [Candidatus Peregrinibacteria bacterium]